MKKQYILTEVKILDAREDGGTIRINTDAIDRDLDRVYPSGAKLENYLKNPVVQWGHNYFDPWAVIGRTNSLEIGERAIDADFTLRDAANESDPQNIVRLLWSENFVRTASIGFMPIEWKENDLGGIDWLAWDLLEWSLVPVPANQEALRLAVKSLGQSSSGLSVPVGFEAPKSAESDENDDDEQSTEENGETPENAGTSGVQGENSDNLEDAGADGDADPESNESDENPDETNEDDTPIDESDSEFEELLLWLNTNQSE